MLYNSNFDDSTFKDNKPNEYNRTIDDPCALQQRGYDNNKKLKFVTTNHRDLIEAKDKLNFFGMTIRDQLFVPGEQMDEDSALRLGETGGKLTNCKVRNGFGQLPLPTMPSRYQLYHGDVDIEDGMKNFLETNRQACNPRDSAYYNRHFYLFDQKWGVEVPDATKSVEDTRFGPRGGSTTRFDCIYKRL